MGPPNGNKEIAQMNSNEIYVTRDLVLATFLKLNNIKLATGYDKKTQSWTFVNPSECDSLSLELRNGESEVEILKYESTRRNLLGMVHDKRE